MRNLSTSQYIQLYAPTSQCEDNEIEKWYNQVQETIDHTPKQDILMVMGDMNAAKVGMGAVTNIVGSHGLGERKRRQTGAIFLSRIN